MLHLPGPQATFAATAAWSGFMQVYTEDSDSISLQLALYTSCFLKVSGMLGTRSWPMANGGHQMHDPIYVSRADSFWGTFYKASQLHLVLAVHSSDQPGKTHLDRLSHLPYSTSYSLFLLPGITLHRKPPLCPALSPFCFPWRTQAKTSASGELNPTHVHTVGTQVVSAFLLFNNFRAIFQSNPIINILQVISQVFFFPYPSSRMWSPNVNYLGQRGKNYTAIKK